MKYLFDQQRFVVDRVYFDSLVINFDTGKAHVALTDENGKPIGTGECDIKEMLSSSEAKAEIKGFIKKAIVACFNAFYSESKTVEDLPGDIIQ